LKPTFWLLSWLPVRLRSTKLQSCITKRKAVTMRREKILKILKERKYAARNRAINAKYDATRKRNIGRVQAFDVAINLIRTNTKGKP